MYTTIITLHKQGISLRQIAKMTNHDRKTIRRIISRFKLESIELPNDYQRRSKLQPLHQTIVNYLESNLSMVRIAEELNAAGHKFSYSSLTRYIKKLKISNDICIRFNTGPGEEAQVDFGDIGKRYDQNGKLRKAYIFNMRLSYSRLDYYEVVFDQKVETWIKLHINAFNYFTGVPAVIKLDNLKAAILHPSFYEPIYQKQYKRFADHYGFLPFPCRVRKPQEKGKVESGIKYICNNFFAGRKFNNFAEMEFALNNWLEYKCNNRIHGTTRVSPKDLFNEKEVHLLQKLPILNFDLSSFHKRKVGKDCHINLENNYYSVPYAYALQEVEVALSAHLVKISAKDKIIAIHTRSPGKGIFVTNRSHYPQYKLYYPESEEYKAHATSLMNAIGTNSANLLELLRKDRSKDWSRTVKGILHLRKDYSDEILDKACKRAIYYGALSYSKIKEIIKNNCYDLPLPETGGGNASSI
jgi:transposase